MNLTKPIKYNITKKTIFCIMVIFLILLNISIFVGSYSDDYQNEINLTYQKNNILYVGGIGENNYTKIQDAIRDSQDGDIVYVYDYSSPYFENIIIDKKIDLIGKDQNTTIIDGRNHDDVIYIKKNNVNLTGFTIQNSGKNWIDSGIKIESHYNNIKNNIIKNNKDGIYSYDLENTNISHNIITENEYYGINIPFPINNTIFKNKITNNKKYGIYLYDSYYIKIIENIIQNNTVGIYLWHSFHITIYNNKIELNKYGIQYNHQSKRNVISNNIISINECGIFFNITSNNEINQNKINKNIYGIFLKDTSYSNLTANQIKDNNYGLYCRFSPENNISKNVFYQNKNGLLNDYSSNNNIISNHFEKNIEQGIILENSSNYNYIKDNNFIKNKINAYFIQSFSNKWEENYWDDWNKIDIKMIYGEIYIFKNLIILNWFNIDKESVEYPYMI